MSTTIRQELIRLRKLKRHAEELGRKKKSADLEHKKFQARVLERLEAEEVDALRSDGTLFSVVETDKGYVEDLGAFVRYALDNDEMVAAFLDLVWEKTGGLDEEDFAPIKSRFLQCVTNMELLKLEARTNLLNAMVRAHLDDGEPMPPGINFRPDPYISMRSS